MQGHVRKRGKKWCFVLDVGRDPETGKRKQKWFSGYKTKKEAQRAMSEKIAEINRGDYIETAHMTFSDLLEMWLEDHVKINNATKSYDRYHELIKNHIRPELGEMKLNSLSGVHLSRFYRKTLEKGIATSSVRVMHQVCRGAFNWGKKMRLIAKNPADDVTPPKLKRTEMKVWTAEQVNQFLRAAKSERMYALFFLAVSTGMRQGEILGLKWEDIDMEQGRISLRRIAQTNSEGVMLKEPKTKGSKRSIDISPQSVEVLAVHRKHQAKEMLQLGYRNSGLVFCTTNGTIVRSYNVREWYDRIIKRAGIPKIRFHDLRHTHATLLLQQGVHPKIVSERLGHSTISITLDTYSHLIPSMQKQAANLMDDILNTNARSN